MHDAALPLLFRDGSPTEKATARTVTMPARPWARKQPKLAVDLSGQYLSLSHLYSSHRQTREITLETFRNALLVWSDCFILDREFQCTYAGQGRNQAQGLANVIGSFAHTTSRGCSMPGR